MEDASDLEFLQWFYENADFGPAHDDVMDILEEQFEEEMGMRVPERYRGG